MKKTLFTLMALICTMSIDAQIVKIMNGDQLVAKYKVPNGGKVVFEKAPDLGIKGKAERKGGIEVNWVQLWEDGPRFAEYNVGAANNEAEDCGGYYYFGMTIDKDMNATYYNGNRALADDDDTATVLWGSNWRMPTEEELEALVNNEICTCTWTTQNGVIGLLCKGKGDYEENSVFLPAAGEFSKGEVIGQDIFGNYWSSTSLLPGGCSLCFYSSIQSVSRNDPDRGLSVRAVLNEAYAIDEVEH